MYGNFSVGDKEKLAIELNSEANKPIEDDFDNYMRKVELVENVLKGLSSNDRKINEIAMKEADLLLKGKVNVNENEVQVKRNRTVINQKAFDNFYKNQSDEQESMTQNAFMKQVEEDSKRRADDRRMRKIESDKHKNEGNKSFREQKFAKALVCYDKAIDILKDSCILYCNRSLTYLKLGLAEKALADAEMSLKANDKSLRGFIYKAQSLWELGREKESKEVIDKASSVLPDQAEYLKDRMVVASDKGRNEGKKHDGIYEGTVRTIKGNHHTSHNHWVVEKVAEVFKTTSD